MDRKTMGTVAAVLLVLALAACGDGKAAGPGAASSPGRDLTPGYQDRPGYVEPQESSTSEGVGPPCAAGGGPAIPAGARTAPTTDLDRDGRNDTLWLNRAGGRIQLGVQFAAGGRAAVTFRTAGAPVSASAGVTMYGTPAVLADTGGLGLVLSGRSCRLLGVTDERGGGRLVLAKGRPGTGTGAGCLDVAGNNFLNVYDARRAADGTYTVTRHSRILVEHGRGIEGMTGGTGVVGTGLPAGNPWVVAAQQIRCGNRAPVSVN